MGIRKLRSSKLFCDGRRVSEVVHLSYGFVETIVRRRTREHQKVRPQCCEEGHGALAKCMKFLLPRLNGQIRQENNKYAVVIIYIWAYNGE